MSPIFIHKNLTFNVMREAMLVLHFIGLTMGLGTGFAHAFLGQAISKMPQDEAIRFRMHALVLGKMGHTGIGLLIISGSYLIIPYLSTLSSNPLLIAKLILVLVLIVLLGMISMGTKKAKQSDPAAHFKKIEPLGKITLIVGLSIVIIAVLIFH